MNNTAKIERLKNWLDMLNFLPAEGPHAKNRDSFWRSELQNQIRQLETNMMVSSLNCLAELARTKNTLRKYMIGNERD